MNREGPDASYRLGNEAFFGRVRRGCLVVNTSRGEVVDEAALRKAIKRGQARAAILDVWEGEPVPDPATIRAARFGTPHVAGYAEEGKLRGTQMIYGSVCRWLGRDPELDILGALPRPEPIRFERFSPGLPREEILSAILRRVYDIEKETVGMRGLAELGPEERGKAFDRLRRSHGPRREFASQRIEIPGLPEEIRATLQDLGFQVM